MHFRYLDSLRGIAILGVMILHASKLSHQPSNVIELTLSGQRGVQLFYVLSAFTLFLSTDNRKNKEKNPTYNFFIRRFFRIAPLYYLAIVGNIIITKLTHLRLTEDKLTTYDIISGFLFVNGFNPNSINSVAKGGWSIAVESSFYILFPLLYSNFNSLKKSILLLILSIFVCIPISWKLADFYPAFTEYFTVRYFPIELPIFCMGIFTYQLWKERENIINYSKVNIKNRQIISIILILYSSAIFIFSFPYDNGTLMLSSSAFIFLILGLAIHNWYFLVNPFTQFLGKISYSLYLIHFFIFKFTQILLLKIDKNAMGNISGLALFMVISYVQDKN